VAHQDSVHGLLERLPLSSPLANTSVCMMPLFSILTQNGPIE
jgi:hypothetical protein